MRSLRIFTRIAAAVAAACCLLVGALVIPLYAFFMRVWLHAPQVPLLAMTVPVALVCIAGGALLLRYAWRGKVCHA